MDSSQNDIVATLHNIFTYLSTNEKLRNLVSETGGIEVFTQDQNLLHLSPTALSTPIDNVLEKLTKYPSNIKDEFMQLELLEPLIASFSAQDAIIRLDHVGFCYQVDSIQEEKKILMVAATNNNLHLYEERSNTSDAVWYFMGNAERNWEDPLIEIVLVEHTDDPRKELWLPHIQIDIDTNLFAEQIDELCEATFKGKVEAFHIVIGKTTYIVRYRLGTISGVNISLDFATRKRSVKAHRHRILKMIV